MKGGGMPALVQISSLTGLAYGYQGACRGFRLILYSEIFMAVAGLPSQFIGLRITASLLTLAPCPSFVCAFVVSIFHLVWLC